MKYIIRRIIIGVGIAVAMMLITRTFSLSAYAFNVEPYQLKLTYVDGSTTNNVTYDTLYDVTPDWYPNNKFLGRRGINSGYRVTQELYKFSVTGKKTGYYDVNFLYYNNELQDYLPNGMTFNLRNDNAIFVCESDLNNGPSLIPFNSNNYNSPYYGRTKSLIGVSCKNVYLNLSSHTELYAIIQASWLMSNTNNKPYGITALTFQPNSTNDVASASNQQTIIDQQQEQTEAIQENTQAQNDTNDILNNDDTSDAQSSASNFFNNFSTTDHGGLSGVITSPLRFINTILGNAVMSGNCSPLQVPLPFVNTSVNLPCADSVMMSLSNGPALIRIITTITNGIIAYWVIVKLFAFIRSAKKPDEDRVEVLDL